MFQPVCEPAQEAKAPRSIEHRLYLYRGNITRNNWSDHKCKPNSVSNRAQTHYRKNKNQQELAQIRLSAGEEHNRQGDKKRPVEQNDTFGLIYSRRLPFKDKGLRCRIRGHSSYV